VVDVDVGVDGFKVGDEVVATWGGMMPMGGLAEYCLVEADLSVIKPPELTPVECAALVNSASHALIGVDGAVLKSTDRVLVLGGSGGAGSALIQLVKDAGVAFIAATSSDTALLTSLGVDRPIDYTVENWWEVQAFLDDPFDVVFDLAEGTVGWNRCRSSGVVKMGWAGGRYYAFLLDEWEIVAKSKMFFIAFAGLLLSRLGSGFVLSKLNLAPAYTMKLSTPDASVITRVLDLAVAGRLKPVLVGAAPYQFTAASTIAAFDMLRSRRAKGKVVIKVAD
jgi:NADPH:quinone reductase-like Zn-dependent oxidoreductase